MSSLLPERCRYFQTEDGIIVDLDKMLFFTPAKRIAGLDGQTQKAQLILGPITMTLSDQDGDELAELLESMITTERDEKS
jgi:hypothetical protein